MAIVAVAGGTGNVGRAIVEAILATGKHQVKILSRKANPALSAEIGAPILEVDYSSVPSIVQVLESHKIDTLISTIAMHSPDGTAPHEIELIRAADLSAVTTRLISSEWGIPVSESRVGTIPSVPHKLAAWEELQKTTSLEYTVFHNGYFMDYWGIPNYPSYLARVPLVTWIDIAHNAAAIPGDGNVYSHFTHTSDVAKFVAASLDLARGTWEKRTFVYGDRLTWNQFLRLAEEAKGVKFDVVYDNVENLKKGQVTELPGQKALYEFIPKEALQGLAAVFGIWFAEGQIDLKPGDHGQTFLNEKVGIETLKVKEMLEKAWKKV
ncbi:isoflavone reductase [Cladorrhinum sp. PSN259]|nr:isoflavone reductase [Cladorrhinum sp. PSN259]